MEVATASEAGGPSSSGSNPASGASFPTSYGDSPVSSNGDTTYVTSQPDGFGAYRPYLRTHGRAPFVLTAYRLQRTQRVAYRWMLNLGKDPERAKRYSENTVSGRSYYIDAFYRWVWDREGYTLRLTREHAYDYNLAYSDASQDYKANHMKAVKMYFRWRAWEFDKEE